MLFLRKQSLLEAFGTSGNGLTLGSLPIVDGVGKGQHKKQAESVRDLSHKESNATLGRLGVHLASLPNQASIQTVNMSYASRLVVVELLLVP